MNKNFIDPELVTTLKILYTKPIRVQTINGKFEIDRFIHLSPFQEKPPLTFFLFKFHTFFDGLIGYESLKELKADIITSSNSLKFPEYSIQKLRKYPYSYSINLNAQEEKIIQFPTDITNGDFYVENNLPLTSDVIVLPGLY